MIDKTRLYVRCSAVMLAGLIFVSCDKAEPGASSSGDLRGSTNVGGGHDPADTVTGPDVTGPPVPDTAVAGIRKYDHKSGIIHYRNSILNREQIFYFDDYGAREALYDILPEGKTASEESPYIAIIHADGKERLFDLNDKTGRIADLDPEPGAILGTIPDVWNKIPIVKKTRRAEDLPARTVLGRETTGYQFNATGNAGVYKVWVWDRIPLYAEIQLDEIPLHLEAISVEVDVPIPADRFAPPANVIFAIE